jgi:hypothetical protein
VGRVWLGPAEPPEQSADCAGPCGGTGGDVTLEYYNNTTDTITTMTAPCPRCGGTGRTT